MKNVIRNLFLSAALLAMASCSVFEPQTPPLHRLTIMYAAAMSNLSSSIAEDIEDICNSKLPTLKSGDVFLVYSHMPARYGYYDIPTEPVLFRAWSDPDGTNHRDTLRRYPSTDISSTAEVMRKVINDALDLFPAPHCGLIISSHGKGWIPAGYKESSAIVFGQESSRTPDTKDICIESVKGSGINITELRDAIPVKMDYIFMDSCLMGCIETAYEARGLCDLLLFSPTEVLVDGLSYRTMAPLILNTFNPDATSVAREYYEFYEAQSGSRRSATVTIVDCNRLEPLADACRDLVSKYREQIIDTPHDNVQPYFYNNLRWFFDLRDIFAQSGIPEEELAALDAALSEAIVYTAGTDAFIGLPLERVCGLSMYKPYHELHELNQFYRTLSWNKAIGLL